MNKNFSCNDLREFCIRHRYFTCGDTRQYSQLFDMVYSEDYSLRDIALIIAICSSEGLDVYTRILEELDKELN